MVASLPQNITANPNLCAITYEFITDLIDSHPAIHHGSYTHISAQFCQHLQFITAQDHTFIPNPPLQPHVPDSDSDSSRRPI